VVQVLLHFSEVEEHWFKQMEQMFNGIVGSTAIVTSFGTVDY
jgi:hypothetical protein